MCIVLLLLLFQTLSSSDLDFHPQILFITLSFALTLVHDFKILTTAPWKLSWKIPGSQPLEQPLTRHPYLLSTEGNCVTHVFTVTLTVFVVTLLWRDLWSYCAWLIKPGVITRGLGWYNRRTSWRLCRNIFYRWHLVSMETDAIWLYLKFGGFKLFLVVFYRLDKRVEKVALSLQAQVLLNPWLPWW